MNQNIAILTPMFIFFALDLIILIDLHRSDMQSKLQRVFRRFCLFVTIMQGLCLITYSHEMGMIYIGRPFLYFITVVSLSIMTVSTALWFRYLIVLMPGKRRNSRFAVYVYTFPVLVIMFTAVASIWTGWLFYYDSDDIFRAGKYGDLQFYCTMAYGFFILYIFGHDLRKRNGKYIKLMLVNFLLYVVPVAIGSYVQLTVFRGGYTQIGISFGLLLMYLEQYMSDMNEIKRLRSVEQLNESLENQISITQNMSNVYYSSYIINLTDNSFAEINSKDKIRDVVGMSGNAQETFYGMCDSLIEPDYFNIMKEFVNLSTIQERLCGKQFITCEYKGKISGWSQAYFIAGDRNSDGFLERVFYATRTIHDEKAREEEASAIIEGLSSEYYSLWLIDKKTMSMKELRKSEDDTIEEAVMQAIETLDFRKASEVYINNYIVPEDRDRAREELREEVILRHVNEPDKMYTVNYLRRSPNGDLSYHQAGFVDASTSTGKEQFVMGFRDVDKVVKAEQKVKKELEEARIAAEAASEAKTVFLNNMSHDIRTPMNAILGFADLLEKDKDDPTKMSDYIAKIKGAGAYLLTIINNVLDVARIESGHVEIDESFVDLSNVQTSAIPLFEDQVKEKNISFTTNMDVKHSYVLLDRTKTQQITVNLLSNAVKYTPEGGKIHMEMKEIPCEKEGYAKYVMTISDNGIGMREEFVEHIFDYFSRERNTTESKIVGTGLGMSIVKSYVELMGGTIEVDSKLGEGTVFTVILTHKIADNVNLYLENKHISGNCSSIEGKRILIAEDNDLNAEIAMEILANVGILSERAEDGIECIRMLSEADEGYYDAILMDIQMPNLNGYDACRQIREMPDAGKAQIPIIAMTANAFEKDKQKALEAGMNGHLAKPVDSKLLISKLEEVIIK